MNQIAPANRPRSRLSILFTMHSDGKAYYPTRSFIRFQAKNLLINALMAERNRTTVSQVQNLSIQSLQDSEALDHSQSLHSTDAPAPQQKANVIVTGKGKNTLALDEELFADITSTAFNADQHPELYRGSSSDQDAMQIEQAIAQEIVAAYQRILKNRTNETIQQLNALF
ncbi:MAG: hypothetical protein AAFU78_09580 [Cyanobacteria bacterium J06633_2]